jgi:hypothetical protein
MLETATIETAATGGEIARAIETPRAVIKNNVRRRINRAGRSATIAGMINNKKEYLMLFI